MSLHVHCHISGGHFLLDLCAKLRYYIFCKELPVVRFFFWNDFCLIILHIYWINIKRTKYNVKISKKIDKKKQKMMMQVLKAFVHGDENLFNNYPELQEASAWVYFHSNIPEFNKVECWGPLKLACGPLIGSHNHNEGQNFLTSNQLETPQQPCQDGCTCCFTPNESGPRNWEVHDPSTLLEHLVINIYFILGINIIYFQYPN